MNVVIRTAVISDAQQLVEHTQRILAEPGVDIPTAPDEYTTSVQQMQEELSSVLASDNSTYLVAEVEGRIVGELRLRGDRYRALRHTAMLGISISTEARGMGVGKRLMAAAVAWAEDNPFLKRVELHVYAKNKAAVHLYESFGFVIEARRPCLAYQDGQYIEDLIMARLFCEKSGLT